jgi:hypothetical protein
MVDNPTANFAPPTPPENKSTEFRSLELNISPPSSN